MMNLANHDRVEPSKLHMLLTYSNPETAKRGPTALLQTVVQPPPNPPRDDDHPPLPEKDVHLETKLKDGLNLVTCSPNRHWAAAVNISVQQTPKTQQFPYKSSART